MIRLLQEFAAVDAIVHAGTQAGLSTLNANFSGLKRDAGSDRFGVLAFVKVIVSPIDKLIAQLRQLQLELRWT